MRYGNSLEYLENLGSEEYSELYKQLVSFAEYRLNYISNSRGVSAEDFVNTALRKAIDDTASDHRRWNIKSNPDFMGFLKGCVSSEISNHFNLKSTETTVDINNQIDYNFFNNLLDSSQANSTLETKEFRERIFEKLIDKDEQLAELLLYQDDGYEVEEIMENLGFVEKKDLYNSRKRLRRACEEIINEYKKG